MKCPARGCGFESRALRLGTLRCRAPSRFPWYFRNPDSASAAHLHPVPRPATATSARFPCPFFSPRSPLRRRHPWSAGEAGNAGGRSSVSCPAKQSPRGWGNPGPSQSHDWTASRKTASVRASARGWPISGHRQPANHSWTWNIGCLQCCLISPGNFCRHLFKGCSIVFEIGAFGFTFEPSVVASAAWALVANAGIIAFSQGRASIAPVPRRIARRARCFQ
jgi:hypothetical protein